MPRTDAAVIAIGVMALVTYATRFGGAWFVQQAELPPMIRRYIEVLGMTLLAALVAPVAVSNDGALIAGVIVAGVAAGVWRRPLASMALAVATTACLRALAL